MDTHQPVKAFSYLRMSTPEQLKGNSLNRQIQKTREFAAAHGWILDEGLSFEDIGKSGYYGISRIDGNFRKILDLISQGEIPKGSVLIVEAIDRISREDYLTAQLTFSKILLNDIRIATTGDGFIYSGKGEKALADLMILVVKLAAAHEESAEKSRRSLHNWEVRRKNARDKQDILTKKLPAWIKLENGKVTLDEDRAEIVKNIFDWTIDGVGKRVICERLNRNDTPTFGPSKYWSESTIGTLLANRSVTGEFQPKTYKMVSDIDPTSGKQRKDPETKRPLLKKALKPAGLPIKDYFPEVVDELTFARARAAIASRITGGGKKGTRFNNLVTGLVTCSECGEKMHFVGKKSRPSSSNYLRCRRAAASAKCSHRKLHRYDLIEQHILAHMGSKEIRAILGSVKSPNDLLEHEISDLSKLLLEKEKQASIAQRALILTLGDNPEIPDDHPDIIFAKSLQDEAKELRSRLNDKKDELSVSNVSEYEIKSFFNSELSTYVESIAQMSDEDAYKARAKLHAHIKKVFFNITIFPDGKVGLEFTDDIMDYLYNQIEGLTGDEPEEVVLPLLADKMQELMMPYEHFQTEEESWE